MQRAWPGSLTQMERRIFGIENEYGVTCTQRGQRRLSPDEVARYLFRRVVSWGRSSNVFLANGARLYLDVGSHPEYATPECDTVYDVVVHDRAGERILEQLIVNAEEDMMFAMGSAAGASGTFERFDVLPGRSPEQMDAIVQRQYDWTPPGS